MSEETQDPLKITSVEKKQKFKIQNMLRLERD